LDRKKSVKKQKQFDFHDLIYKFAVQFEKLHTTTMAKVCEITGKRPHVGNNVSHANNKTKRRFNPNLQRHKFWVESENRWIRLRITTSGMRVIDKKGIDAVLVEMRKRGEKI